MTSRFLYHLRLPSLAAAFITVLLLLADTHLSQAVIFNPGCNVTQLVSNVAAAGANGQADVINLTANCEYVLDAPLVIHADAGNLLTFNGNGATLFARYTSFTRVLQVHAGANVAVNSTIITNGRADFGGAIQNNGTLTLTNSTVYYNSATTGGAIDNGGVLSLLNSNISNNNASNGGGIRNTGTLTVTNSSIVENNAPFGGGILHEDGTSTLTNATVSTNGQIPGNDSAGGGIYVAGGTLTLNNATLSQNGATEGGALFQSGGMVTLNNTILANSVESGDCIGVVTAHYSLIEDAVHNCGMEDDVDGNIVGVDPLIIELANNGGGTLSHKLLDGSPAIDTGSNDLIPPGITTDQRGAGFPRVQFAIVDMGALESDHRIPPTSGASLCFSIIFPYTVPAGDVAALRRAIDCADYSGDVINLTQSVYALDGDFLRLGNYGTVLTIHGNGATISGGGASRVFYIASSNTLTLTDMILAGGRASNGGAILNETQSTLNLINVTIESNEAYRGGGIYNIGTLALEGSGLYWNDATIAGAGIYNVPGATVTLLNSSIVNNEAGQIGGGIANYGALTLTNTTVGSNIATGIADMGVPRDGGAGIFSTSSVILHNSTIAYNTTPNGVGSGLQVASGTAVLNNTIISNNSTDGTYQCEGSSVTANFSLIEDGSCGVTQGINGNRTGNALLGVIGGHPFAYMPYLGSPAADAGSNELIPDGITTDQQGNPRIRNTVVDMGAYESYPALIEVTLTLQGRTPPPNDAYVTTVYAEVRLAETTTGFYGAHFVTDSSGVFTIEIGSPGRFDIWIKGAHTLAVVRRVTVSGIANALTATLPEGDANDDNQINLTDFSLLAAAFGTTMGNPGYNAQVDFNGDGQVQLIDFSLLAGNYGQAGAP